MRVTDNKNFRGSNKLTAMTSYYYGLLYTVVHEPGSKYKKIKKNVHDFHRSENILYGRALPVTFVPIVLKEQNLVAPKNQSGPNVVKVFSFVADAFNDLMDRFDTAQFKNHISADAGWLNSPRPERGHVAVTQLYRDYREASYTIFMDYLDKNKLHSKIHDFDSFYVQFFNYFKIFCRALPFTFEAFVRSNLSDTNTTGLAIDLAKWDASDDQKKVNNVFSNPNYRFYENATMQHGFKIDKHCPWRIIADINSPAMQKYIQARGFSNGDRVIRGGYEPAYLLGYNAFKGMIVDYYNTYVSRKPAYISPRRNGVGDYVSFRRQRQRVDIFELLKKHGEKYFLEKYVTFRSMEEDDAFTDQKIKNITDRALELAKVRGMTRALRYINEDVCKTSRKSGSFAHKHQRRTTKEMEEKRRANAPAPGSMKY